MLKKIDGKWYDVEITQENSVIEGPREAIFKTKIKNVTWKVVEDPGRLEEGLESIEKELEETFSDGERNKVHFLVFCCGMAHELGFKEEALEDLVKALIERTSAYQIRDGYIFRPSGLPKEAEN